MTKGMSISIVVPVYNSEGTIEELVTRIHAVVDGVADVYELILVNDGSRDRSWDSMLRAAEGRSWIRLINLMRNYGQHNALLCGIRAARYATLVTLDDDLQNPPEEIPKLLERLTADVDVVYGAPSVEQHGLWRNLASRLTKIALLSSMGPAIARQVSAFRVFRTQLRDAFASYKAPYVSIDVLLTWATTRFCAIPVQQDPRRVGPSNYTFRKLTAHALNMMTGFSTLPLQVASLLGFVSTALGLLVLGWVIGVYLFVGSSVPGFPFLASVIAIFSGAQMFALGIIGEYLARMHFRTMDRPAYSVRELTGDLSEETERTAAMRGAASKG
jgi:undecaprenyl-phosphate 4-deoxy-4-formamido-L-arabinose transferase